MRNHVVRNIYRDKPAHSAGSVSQGGFTVTQALEVGEFGIGGVKFQSERQKIAGQVKLPAKNCRARGHSRKVRRGFIRRLNAIGDNFRSERATQELGVFLEVALTVLQLGPRADGLSPSLTAVRQP